MIEILAAAVVVLTGLYFVALGIGSFLAPASAERFLFGFASSAAAHYSELIIRLAVGASFIAHSPRMEFSSVFRLSGLIVVITTAVLLAVPWRRHQQFARQTVPYVARHMRLFGVASFALAALVVFAVIRGAA